MMVSQAYELVKDHAEDTGLIERAYQVHWWQFTRVIRNCVFHSGLVRPCGKGRGRVPFPVSWRALSFVDSMIDKSLLIDRFFTKRHAFDLVADTVTSVETEFAR